MSVTTVSYTHLDVYKRQVSECEEYAVPAYEDPTNDDAAHAVIDHRAFLPDDKKKERRRIRELLALKADERGIAYRPD